MNAVLPVWGEYGGLATAVQCAVKHAGCEVHVIAAHPIGASVFHPMSSFPFSNRILKRLLDRFNGTPGANLHAHSIARWFVVREMVTTKRITLPIYVFDWDVLIFTHLLQAWVPFAECDYAVSVEMVNDKPARTAPSYVNVVEPLNAFCATVECLLHTDAPVLLNPVLDDMMIWAYIGKLYEWKVGDTARIHGGSVFDHHLMTVNGMFRLGDLGKRIEWVEGKPYFVHNDGRLIRANTLHCWGPFKNAEPWLLRRSEMT